MEPRIVALPSTFCDRAARGLPHAACVRDVRHPQGLGEVLNSVAARECDLTSVLSSWLDMALEKVEDSTWSQLFTEAI